MLLGGEQRKVKLEVEVYLDRLPGPMHTQESAQRIVQKILDTQLFSYYPRVKLVPEKE